jgi:ribonuclease P protein component
LSRQVGSAVARNRLRRRLRAIVASTPLPTGLLLIGASTGARPSATELTFEELASHVVDLSRRLPTTP